MSGAPEGGAGTGLLSGASPLVVVVGSGGVGKTTLAAALGLRSARQGRDTLVMTFDPSLRLKDALGVTDEARDREVPVPVPMDPGPQDGEAGGTGLEGGTIVRTGTLEASLLDPRRTFDRLVERYAPDEAARRRILENRFYRHLAGTLSGVLEYMAVERLFEVSREERYSQVVLDTPPTTQALDFLEAPARIVGFLESGALKIALRDWFDEEGHLKASTGWRFLDRKIEHLLDRVIGLEFLREMLEFFQSFGPLYDGFRERAGEVEELLKSERTRFVLVAGPGEERIPDTLFFARKLREAGYSLGPIVVNRLHPPFDERSRPAAAGAEESAGPGTAVGRGASPCTPDGRALFAWLGEQDRRGFEQLRSLLHEEQPLVGLPLQAEEPTDLAALDALGRELLRRLDEPAEPS